MQAMSISEGRKRLFELRESVVDDFETVILTHKKGNVVLISLEVYESWFETLRLMQDERSWNALQHALKNPQEIIEHGAKFEDVFADLLAPELS